MDLWLGRIENRAGGRSAYEFPNSPKEPPTSARRLPQNKNKSEDQNGMATFEKESLVRPFLQKLMKDSQLLLASVIMTAR